MTVTRKAAWGVSVALASALAGGAALANGGGTDYVYLGGGVGAFRPKKQTTVRLLTEDLVITLEGARNRLGSAERDDPAKYRHEVVARYRLANPGPVQVERYGVPIVVSRVPEEGDTPNTFGRGAENAAAVAGTVRISVAGKEHRCQFHPEPARPSGVVPEDLSMIGGALAGLVEEEVELAGMCVVDLTLPPGEFDLTLAYSAPLFGLEEHPSPAKECQGVPAREVERCRDAASDGDERCEEIRSRLEFEESGQCHPLPEVADPFLYYPFGAAASWAGGPSRVSVTVKLGGFRADRKANRGVPDDAVESRGALSWSWKAPALAGLDIMLPLSVPGAKNAAIRSFNGASPSGLRGCRADRFAARASSVLAPIGERSYEPDGVLDGVGATAWCVRTKRGGVGEWIELRFPSPGRGDGRSSSAGLYLLPGLGGSQRLYEGNGRVKRIRYGPCGRGAKQIAAEVPVNEDVLESVVQVPGSDKVIDDLLAGTTAGAEACLRVEIAEVLPGARSADVCISELTLPFWCR